MNLVVCGRDGTLKSSVSERILQKTDRRSDKELEDCQISVVELPALFNTWLSKEEVMRQTLHCVSRCHPGVHVFLLIIPDAPLTDEDKREIAEIQRIFSSRINKHVMFLTIQSSEHQSAELNEETQSVIERFGGRHNFFGPTTQVPTLMEKIKQTLEKNRGGFFSTRTFFEAHIPKLLQFEEIMKSIHSLEAQGSTETEDDLRIVLLGKPGVGKSATGNTILGRNAFAAEESFQPVTIETQRETVEIYGRHITVIDTPGLFDTELTNEEIQREITNCTSMILPGPHVFLLLIPLGRFTKHEETSVKIIQEMFGENSLKYTMVLFTRGDGLRNKTIEQCLGKPGSPLMNLIEACGNRYHVFNNNQTEDRTQVTDLLQKIDNMVKTNGGSFYSCKKFRQMEREKQEQQMKILMETVEQVNREREELIKKHEKEMKREREAFIKKIEQMKHENERLKQEILKSENKELQSDLEAEHEKMMNITEERQNYEIGKMRKEKISEREEIYQRDISKTEENEKEMCGDTRSIQEQWEKQKVEERQREKDDISREKETHISDKLYQTLQIKIDKMIQMRKLNEIEKQEQAENSDKKLNEDIGDIGKYSASEEKPRPLEEKHDKELKSGNWEYERQTMYRKSTKINNNDDSLHVTAYRELMSQYNKWSWCLRSAMIKTENKLQNQIENEDIHGIEENDLRRELNEISEEVTKSMSQLLEKDEYKDLIAQWKTSEVKIRELQENIVEETNKKLNGILQQRDLKKKTDTQRTEHENTLYEKSKELALKLGQKTINERKLKREFGLFWEQNMKKIIKDTPAVKEIDVMKDMKVLLSDVYECAHWRDKKDISCLQSFLDYVKTNKSSYALSKDDDIQIRSLVTDVVQQTDKMIKSFNISNMGYNISCVQQLTDYIKKRVTEHQEGVKYKLKNEFFRDVVYFICKRSNKIITDQHKLFREARDPAIYFTKKREEYFTIFQTYLHGATSAAIFGKIICHKLKEPIEQCVYKKTARDLAGEMRSNCDPLNGNRSDLEKHILKTLAEEEDFDKYMDYFNNPRDHFKSFIRDEVSRYITDKFSVSVLPKMKENLELLQEIITKAAHESTEHAQVNSGNVEWWLKSFTWQLSDELIFSEKDLRGINHDDVDDFKLLEDVVTKELVHVMFDISSEFFTERFLLKLDHKFRPDELLIDHFCQCCWVQCPFCGVSCTNAIENHHGDHSVDFHRVRGLIGASNYLTQNLCVDICTNLVASDRRFYIPDDWFKYREYRRAGGVYSQWSITPDLSELPYWKWFVCRFQKDLEKYYKKTFEESGKIPDEWRTYSKQEAIISLN